ncbi:MAG: site-2 protease family protein, partial [Candidatus Eremiobacteraeota bacterium]|nr:site-2 protease family protein [Candidatus Eremiobacteraeota bacterium]
SISLGIFNFLPIPALDGGRGVFIVAELFRGKPVDPEKEAFVHFAGFAALMLLMVFVTYHDILRLVAGKGVL